jgi:hypothetical protein
MAMTGIPESGTCQLPAAFRALQVTSAGRRKGAPTTGGHLLGATTPIDAKQARDMVAADIFGFMSDFA